MDDVQYYFALHNNIYYKLLLLLSLLRLFKNVIYTYINKHLDRYKKSAKLKLNYNSKSFFRFF